MKGRYFVVANPAELFLFHTQQYLNIFIFDAISAVVNGWLAVSTIAPFGLMSRLYCSHRGAKGITVSHLQAVVPQP